MIEPETAVCEKKVEPTVAIGVAAVDNQLRESNGTRSVPATIERAAQSPFPAEAIENPKSKIQNPDHASTPVSGRSSDVESAIAARGAVRSAAQPAEPATTAARSSARSATATAGAAVASAGPNGAARPALTILHLRTIKGRGGGPEKTLLASSRHIGGNYDLRLVYIRPDNDDQYDMPARAARAGASLIDIPERNGWDPRTVTRLAGEIRASRPALLHAHDHKTNVLALALGRMFRLPVLTTMHGNVTRGGRLEFYYRLERPALRRMDRVIAVSPDLVDYALQIGVPQDRLRLVENAIDLDQFTRRTSVAEAKRRLGLSPDRLLIGAVGRLSEEKGFDRLIEAVARLSGQKGSELFCAKHPSGRSGKKVLTPFVPPLLDLVILGEGPQRAALERLITQHGLTERVRLVGYQADTVAWFEAMDLFVLSSLREGLPNVVLEAMALEVPVVATRIAGVPRLVQDGENGLLVEPDDVDGLSRAIGRLVDDPELRSQFATAARKTIETGYSFEQRMAKIRAIYAEVLGEREGSSPTRKRGATTNSPR